MSSTPLTDDELAVLDRATGLFATTLRAPLTGGCRGCPDWSRRECVNHVLGGGLRYAAYFPQLPEGEIAWTRTADHAGDDPVAALAETSRGLRAEFVAAPDADAAIRHRFAVITVRELLALRVLELLLHSWDLDPDSWRADEARRLAAWALEHGTTVLETMRTFDVFADVVPLGADTAGGDPRDLLLTLSGRRSAGDWSP